MNKRLLSVVLVLVLMLSLGTTAFGASEPSTVTTLGGLIEITNIKSKGNPYEDEHYSMSKIEENLGGFADNARPWDEVNNSLYFAEAPVTITMKDAETNGIIWYSYYYKKDVEPRANISKYSTGFFSFDLMDYSDVTAYQGTFTVEEPGVYYFYFDNGGESSSDRDMAIYLVIEGGTTAPSPTPAPAKSNATPTASTVLVNNAPTEFEAYTIEGNNYFKLRDLAQVVNGTEKNFEVEWDGAKNAINLISNTTYTPAGGELAKGDNTAKNATPTTSTIYKDGVEIKLTAYTINENNFFKLRDIAEAFDIGITWDNATKTIGIDTSIGYVAE